MRSASSGFKYDLRLYFCFSPQNFKESVQDDIKVDQWEYFIYHHKINGINFRFQLVCRQLFCFISCCDTFYRRQFTFCLVSVLLIAIYRERVLWHFSVQFGYKRLVYDIQYLHIFDINNSATLIQNVQLK